MKYKTVPMHARTQNLGKNVTMQHLALSIDTSLCKENNSDKMQPTSESAHLRLVAMQQEAIPAIFDWAETWRSERATSQLHKIPDVHHTIMSLTQSEPFSDHRQRVTMKKSLVWINPRNHDIAIGVSRNRQQVRVRDAIPWVPSISPRKKKKESHNLQLTSNPP